MKQPANWDSIEVQTNETYRNLPPGGYVCKIISAYTDQTTTGKERLNIKFDIHGGEYNGFFGERFDQQCIKNPNAQWQGIYKQITEGENSEKFFKAVVTAIENSNPGYKWNFDETTLRGKLFGGVFGFEEWINQQGEIKQSIKCRFIRSVDGIKDVKIPDVKKVSGNTNKPFTASDFGVDVENLPFK